MILDKFYVKFLVAFSVALISVLYKLETNDDMIIVDKDVILAKSSIYIFDFITRLEDYPSWFPNIKTIDAVDNEAHISIGKMYKQKNSYLFGIGEASSTVVVVGYDSPSYFEFIADTVILERTRLTIQSVNQNRTKLNWKLYSRQRNLLFYYVASPFYKFYYNQLVREALFKLQFSFKQ